MRMKFFHAVIPAVAIAATVSAQSSTPPDVLGRIREEATTRSQIMRTLHVLTDVYGPRVTGSPSLKAAGENIR